MTAYPTEAYPTGLHVSDDFDQVLRQLDGISAVVNDNADYSDQLGELTDEVVDAVRRTGAFKISIPRVLGGYEFSPRQIIETVERLSYADAAAGWSFMAVQMITGTTAAYLGDDAARELFPDVAGDRYALVAGQGTKLGNAVPVPGGYRISGHWQFASGISMASHIHTAALCAEIGRALVFTLPKDQVRFIDNWDVMGLRATKSIDYTCEDVFVPQSHVYELATMQPRNGASLYRMGLANMAGIGHTGWALGVGRRMLDEMATYAGRKTGTPQAAVDTEHFYADYARAESKLRSARAWAMEVWAGNEETLRRDEFLSTEQETLTRLMLNNTTWSAHAVAQTVYQWAGTTALRRGTVQRFFRDLHAGTQHVTSGPLVLHNCGKWLSGLATPESRWVFLNLEQPE